MMLAYQIKLEPDDNATLLVTCPDLPGVVTFGGDRASALSHAVDAIEAMMASMMAHDEDIPCPGTGEAGEDVAIARLPLLTSLKILLYKALREDGVTRAELARRLGWSRESVDRLLRIDHASKVEQIEAAFRALGREFAIEVKQVA